MLNALSVALKVIFHRAVKLQPIFIGLYFYFYFIFIYYFIIQSINKPKKQRKFNSSVNFLEIDLEENSEPRQPNAKMRNFDCFKISKMKDIYEHNAPVIPEYGSEHFNDRELSFRFYWQWLATFSPFHTRALHSGSIMMYPRLIDCENTFEKASCSWS